MNILFNKIKNTKIFCIICLVSILILILILLRYNYVEKYQDYNENNFNNTGMYVLYIPKREKYIKDIMNKLNFNPEHVKGPDKNKLNLEQLKKDGFISNKKIRDGIIACALGHHDILNKFLKTNKKYALIFEDDIFIPQEKNKQIEISTKIKNLINNIPIDADIVYFGYCFENCSKKYKYNEYFNKSVRPSCTHLYFVSRKGANKIINNIKPFKYGIDIHYMDLINNKILNSYSVNSNYLLIEQNRDNLGSELDNDQKLRACI
tara:strand:- start:132 stop:920 length:789 start_codon:yes stop_codon:yes gene_type:complete